jgi:putative transposase
MSAGMRRTLIPHPFSNLAAWPAPDIGALSGEVRTAFMKRREAVEMYAAGEPYHAIREQTGKGEDEVRRLVQRCITPDGNGGIFGFKALIPGVRTQAYTRTKEVVHAPGSGSSGCAGALQQLLVRYPDIADLVEEQLFKRASRDFVHEARISYRNLHREFKKQLRKRGLTDNDWPFNTTNYGYNALVKYCNLRRDQHLGRWIRVRSGADASRRSSVGLGYRTLIPVFRPLSQVQLDFHKIDAASIITLVTEFGTELEIPLSRWYIGILADERSHAVLGVYIALEVNPSGDSVLETIESAVRPDIKSDERSSTLFLDARVLPNQILPGMAFQGCGALKMDNAWSNTATEVLNNLIDVLGCAVNFGPVRAWWRRSLIERIFRELTGTGVQRLPSTFGTGPSDTRNEGANEKAVGLKIMLSDLTDIIFKCVKEYNETASEGLQFASPLNVLRAAFENPASGFLPQSIPASVQGDLRLMRHVRECPVRGDIRKNVRPYVQVDRCRYTNTRLAHSYDLVGKTVVVYIDRRDCRIAHGTVKETGEELGPLVPEQRWAMHAVSMRDRKLINRSGLAIRTMSQSNDPVADWSKDKKRELLAQRKGQKNRLKSSKEALSLARIAPTVKAKAQAPSAPPAPVDASTLSPDPFGLREVPPVRSTTRRS